MYPDAVFLALVRNGFAVCESYLRRGGDVQSIASLYSAVCGKMVSDSEAYANYHIIKYEDLVADTLETVKRVFALAELDAGEVSKLRLVVRGGGKAEGHSGGEARELAWYSWEEFADIVTPEYDRRQLTSLSDSDRQAFLLGARESMAYFGYA
jgi:hypothetical protein